MKTMNNIMECVKGLETRLASALVEAYNAILESRVNQVFTALYNFCIRSGDWIQCPPGKHEVKVQLDTGEEMRNFVARNYKQGYEPRDAMLRKITFSTSKNSDHRNFDNKITELHAAYLMACDAEYELCGHDKSKMKWPARMQRFMDVFCDGHQGWPPEGTKLEDKPVKQAADVDGQKEYEPTKLTGENANIDTKAWGWDNWKKFANGKQKK